MHTPTGARLAPPAPGSIPHPYRGSITGRGSPARGCQRSSSSGVHSALSRGLSGAPSVRSRSSGQARMRGSPGGAWWDLPCWTALLSARLKSADHAWWGLTCGILCDICRTCTVKLIPRSTLPQ
eukprot:scaffold104135_cov27-Tisochrysis_lutea.AAC.1